MKTEELLKKAGFKHYLCFWWAWDFIPAINRLIAIVRAGGV